MVFTSPIFIFYFLPVFLAVYGAAMIIRHAAERISRAAASKAGKRGAAAGKVGLARRLGSFWMGNLVILLFSLLFYYWGENNAVLLLMAVILFNYGWAFLLVPDASRENAGKRGTRIAICVAVNILCLFVFKYAGFASSLVARALDMNIALSGLSLPLGISFFIFQAMSYVIDVYRGTVERNRSFIGFACYISMFPQLVAGPIVRYADIAAQLKLRVVSLEKFASGVERFVFGLAKKILVANNVALFADAAFGIQPERVTPSIAWMGVICYAVQIYFDFSGYSDMAIGMGRMLGFDFKENFLHPYSAISMQDFWRRWHVSLSTWFRDYLYIPLGGNRNGNFRTYVNLCVVFLLCGLWHGAAVNFILWGGYHGMFLIFERATNIDFKRRPFAGRVYTLTAVLFGWLLFRAESFDQIAAFLKAMLWMDAALIQKGGDVIWVWFSLDVKMALAAGILLSFPIYDFLQRAGSTFLDASGPTARRAILAAGQLGRVAMLAGLLLACIPFMINDSYNPFIYFRF